MPNLFDDKLISYLKEHVRNYEGLPYWSLAMGIRGLMDEAQTKWQPIETAPRDGSEFVTLNANQGNCKRLIFWNRIYGYWTEKGTPILRLQDTHWMPLPEGPK